MPVPQQPVDKVASDKARAAGDKTPQLTPPQNECERYP
jgi:hypothetical protein